MASAGSLLPAEPACHRGRRDGDGAPALALPHPRTTAPLSAGGGGDEDGEAKLVKYKLSLKIFRSVMRIGSSTIPF